MLKKSFQRPALKTSIGLKLTYEVNKTTTDFLDVKMDLRSGEFKPYMKPNDKPIYISKQSNHPPHILRTFLLAFATGFPRIQAQKQYSSKLRDPTSMH